MSATVGVKCVLCRHRETIPLTGEQPMCSKCMGPVVVESATTSSTPLPRDYAEYERARREQQGYGMRTVYRPLGES